MAISWEVFPSRPWPKYFGHREIPPRTPAPHPDQLDMFAARVPIVVRSDGGAVANLRDVFMRSRLCKEAFARLVLGCAGYTFTRWLNRERRLPESRQGFAARLVSVAVHGEHLVILLRLRSGDVHPRRRYRYGRQHEE